MKDRIEDRARFDLIRYANCWEDADVLCEALQPRPGTRVLSVASGGDNSIALAACGAEVVAADLSPAQTACVELKCAAIRNLDYDALLGFLGVLDADDRLSTYAGLKGALSERCRTFWSSHNERISAGLIHAGKFEAYFRIFRTMIMPLVHSRPAVNQLLEVKDEAARRAFYDRKWDSFRWRLLFSVFFSRLLMGRLGRDPEFFRFVEGPVSARILSRVRHALTVLPTHVNPYLHYILRGNYGKALPRYLRPEHFGAVRDGLDRLTLFQGPIQEAARIYGKEGFDGFNLSDIFEYLHPEMCREIYAALLDVAKPGARLAYWNMLVPRRCPGEVENRVRFMAALSKRLFKQDFAFFYSAFIVEEVP